MGFMSIVMTLSVLSSIIGLADLNGNDGMTSVERPDLSIEDEGNPLELTVILERFYLDGEMSEEELTETIWSMEDFWSEYAGWELVRMDENIVVFKQLVDDISPLLKANGYFGLSEDGVLTIFYGRPDRSNIIQSFFQIDVGKLESRKRQQLQNGIPIKTKAEYEKVLETFEPYNKDERYKN
ncbi:BofC C-terminal domain-containing protein [Mesobacillus foraminis]|uniref:BofC C-terminal domain-containing protein n=1 Tax=Mesobacillus foraminis TaxID=279826 RepID=UPI0020365BC5|nr:intercompartmental signaling factor BofC [Mesobacillus foraminis]